MRDFEEHFVPHLAELRRRLILSFISLTAASVFVFVFSGRVLEFLLGPIREIVAQLYFFSPAEAFYIRLQITFWGGLLLSLPVLLTQLWSFLTPALYEKERGVIIPLSFSILLFFILGALFAFYAVLPPALRFFMAFSGSGLEPLISVKEYFSLVGGTLFAFGAGFNLPVVVVILSRARILSGNTLARYRRHVVVVLLFLAAVLTPTTDAVGMLFLALPLWLLFETSLVVVRILRYN